jgi:hypothetical protein
LAGVKGIYQIEFTKDDCIRSGIVKRILERYELDEQILLGETNPYDLDVEYNPIVEILNIEEEEYDFVE